MEWNDLQVMVAGAVLSGVVGWLFAWNSSRRITETHAKLTLLMTALEAERVVTFKYDAKGKPVGVVLELSGTTAGTSSATAELTVERAPVALEPARTEDR
jgi:ABC-type branched-subunit amino acid transport system permease subunit